MCTWEFDFSISFCVPGFHSVRLQLKMSRWLELVLALFFAPVCHRSFCAWLIRFTYACVYSVNRMDINLLSLSPFLFASFNWVWPLLNRLRFASVDSTLSVETLRPFFYHFIRCLFSLHRCRRHSLGFLFNFPTFPCHRQPTEREKCQIVT